MTEGTDELAGFVTTLSHLERFTPEEQKRIADALQFAKEKHAVQKRLSGEPYIIHPVAVAQLCIDEFSVDADVVLAALLHDTVEDCGVALEEIESRFGPRVRTLVDACTNVGENDGHAKILDWYVRTNKSHEKLRRIGAQESGAFFIKVADRWDNVLASDGMRPYNQDRLAQDALSFTVPLCRELGFVQHAERIEAASKGAIERAKRRA